ncbi:Intraflagellar transport protein 46 [Diplonema papillatum]|nr:Intraflagellar transport protein 46 [Diplonema papillatum]
MSRDDEESLPSEVTDDEEEDEDEEEEETDDDEEDEDDEDDEAAAKMEAVRRMDEEEREKKAKEDALRASALASAAGAEEVSKRLINEPHDEAVDITGAEDLPTPPPSTKYPSQDAVPVTELKDDTHDASMVVDGDAHVATPTSTAADYGEKTLKNQSHDAAFDVSGADADEHVMTPPARPSNKAAAEEALPATTELKNESHDMAYNVDDGSSVSSAEHKKLPSPLANIKAPLPAVSAPNVTGSMAAVGHGGGEDDSSSDEDGGGTSPSKMEPKGLYDAAEFENLDVSKEVKDLFQFITVYKAHEVEVEPKLHPFVPEFIPAIGDIDGFIKVTRPDEKQSNLGLSVLDEPSCNQSNASIVIIQLEYEGTFRKKVAEKNIERIEGAATRPKSIDSWISSMQKLRQAMPRTQVNYTKPMPDLEMLLQVWPAEFEDLLDRNLVLPPAKIDLNIVQYVRLVCTLLDIPYFNNLVESVHVLLSLYSEFKANPHFQGGAFSM